MSSPMDDKMDQALDQAAEWCVRLSEGELPPGEQAALDACSMPSLSVAFSSATWTVRPASTTSRNIGLRAA